MGNADDSSRNVISKSRRGGGTSSLARVWLEKYPALIAKHEGKTPVATS